MGKAGVAAAIITALLIVGVAVYVGNNPISKATGSLYQKVQNIGAGYLSSAQLTIYMQDPPDYTSDVSSIQISFSEIDLLSTNGSWIKVSGSQATIDLLQIISLPKDLGTFRIPAGTYISVRFMVDQAQATISGKTVLLQIPSGSQTGLKVTISNGLTVSAGGGATLNVHIQADNNGIHNGLLIPAMSASVS